MWLLLLAGFAVGGLFLADESVHPEKYPEQSRANGIEISAPVLPVKELPSQENR